MSRASKLLETIKMDKMYVNKSIKNFNRSAFPYSNGTIDQKIATLADSIIKDLMWPKSKLSGLTDHLRWSLDHGDKMGTDATDILSAGL